MIYETEFCIQIGVREGKPLPYGGRSRSCGANAPKYGNKIE